MRIAGNNTNYNNKINFEAKHLNLGQKAAKNLAKMDGIGEGASIAFDFLGKAVVVPAVIMLSSKEPKENKEYSALKNPVAAVIQLLLEVPILIFGSKAIENAANKGCFDKNKNHMYNEKLSKDNFISALNNSAKSKPDIVKNTEDILNLLNNKGLTRKVSENIEDFIKTMPEETGNLLKQNYNEYKTVHKNLFHLKNRLCFAAAIIMTPILCALENKLHPIVMDKIYEKEQTAKKVTNPAAALENHKIKHPVSIHAFIQHVRGQK